MGRPCFASCFSFHTYIPQFSPKTTQEHYPTGKTGVYHSRHGSPLLIYVEPSSTLRKHYNRHNHPPQTPINHPPQTPTTTIILSSQSLSSLQSSNPALIQCRRNHHWHRVVHYHHSRSGVTLPSPCYHYPELCAGGD